MLSQLDESAGLIITGKDREKDGKKKKKMKTQLPRHVKWFQLLEQIQWHMKSNTIFPE